MGFHKTSPKPPMPQQKSDFPHCLFSSSRVLVPGLRESWSQLRSPSPGFSVTAPSLPLRCSSSLHHYLSVAPFGLHFHPTQSYQYYLRSGGCKFGKACKYNHTRGACSAAPILELNFLGLPIRLGEKECPYYMRTGSCKFGANCKFNHPDPTAVGGCDPPSGYGNGGSMSLQGVSQPSLPSWSSPRRLNETAAFMPMVLSPTQGVSPQSSEWNAFQAPVYLSERSMYPPSTYVMNNPAIETNVYMHPQKQMQVDEFPERPGEPECSYFLKTGDCKFKSNCKFHHPRSRIAKSPSCTLSDKGLPLRPDQNVCMHYSRYGICKFGPACKFDHPINPLPSAIPGLDRQSYSNSASVEVAGVAGSGGASDAIIQQSVNI